MYLRLEIARQHRIPRRWPLLVMFIPYLMQPQKCICFFFIVLAGQVGVLHKNIKKYLKGKSLDSEYDGYASCPLVTGYDSCIMAEFDYELQPKETFPFRQDRERYSMFLVKRDIFPFLYWNLMLNGYWNGPAIFRKVFSIFKRK